MSVTEELNNIILLHDAYSAVRFDRNKPVKLIDQFNEWHGKASTLFCRHISPDDPDLQMFKNIEQGNCFELAGISTRK